jgi:hypothetical protein
MATGFSRYLQRELLDHVLKTGAYTQPANIYVALFNAGPTECTGTGYARELCNVWDPASDADPSVASNTGVIDFGNGAADWGTLTHFALYDAITGGNLLSEITALVAQKTINAGDPVSFPAGDLDVSLD